MSTPEIRIERDCSQKLENIETEIQKAKEHLERLLSQDNSELADQIQELQTTLEALEREKEEIISETQGALGCERSDIYIETQDETQRQQAIAVIQNISSPEDLSNIKLEWGIIGIVLQILQVFFWWTYENKNGQIVQTATEPEIIASKKQQLQNPERPKTQFDFYQLLESKDGKYFQPYEDMILKWTWRIWNIDPWLLLRVMIKEWSKWNLRAGPWWRNSAVWLGQITTPTWNMICDTIWPKQYGIYIDKIGWRYDAESQVKAMCMYLDYCARLRNVDHATAVVYYHMWPGKINDQTATNYLRNNPAVARHHRGQVISVASYEEAAKNYYLW